jgi:Fur family transcriptional regulator, ferric uptake regulator
MSELAGPRKIVMSGEPNNPDQEQPLRGPDTERLRRELNAYMAKRGLRSTEQRRLIIDTFFEAPEHITIDQLLERVREKDPRIGYATVYRTMKMLADGAIVHERKFGDGFTRYELADDEAHHDHLICLECGRITEFEEPKIEELQEGVAARYGFEVLNHKHELYGTCSECVARREQARAAKARR